MGFQRDWNKVLKRNCIFNFNMFYKSEVYEFQVSGKVVEKQGNPRELGNKELIAVDNLLDGRQMCIS